MICIDSDFAIAILKGDNEANELLLSLEEKGERYISKFNELSEIKATIVGKIVKKSNSTIFIN